MSNKNILRVGTADFQDIVESLGRGLKIKAIKRLRDATKPACSLKEAKWAVERLAFERGLAPGLQNPPNALKIVCGPVIRKMILNYGNGDVELDLDAMQLKALMDMQTIGLDACRDILQLVDVLKAFSDGQLFKVLPNSDLNDPL